MGLNQVDLFLLNACCYQNIWHVTPYTTASDALWSGLPALIPTLQSFTGRVAASYLNAIGFPSLINNTQ